MVALSPSLAGSDLQDLDSLALHITTQFPESSDADALKAARGFPDEQRKIIYPPTITRFVEGLLSEPISTYSAPTIEESEEMFQQRVNRKIALIPDQVFEKQAELTGKTIEELRLALRQKIEMGLRLDR